MAKNVLIQRLAQAMNIDSLNRSFVHTAEIENGMVFASGARSANAGESEVFTIAAPEKLTGLWMAYEPEVVMTKAGEGKFYKGLNPDVRDFSIMEGQVFSGFMPQVGDLLVFTGGGVLAGTYEKGTSTHINATAGSMQLTWGTAAAENAFSAKLVEESYISITDGSVIGGTQRVQAFIFEVVAN